MMDYPHKYIDSGCLEDGVLYTVKEVNGPVFRSDGELSISYQGEYELIEDGYTLQEK